MQEMDRASECSYGMLLSQSFSHPHRASAFPQVRAPSAALALLLGCITASSWAGIPEPDLVWYGRVSTTVDGSPIRLTAGTLEWRIEPVSGGPAWVLTAPLTNINDQFSYILRIPCESPEPGGGVAGGANGVLVLSNPPIAYRRATVTLDGQPLLLVNAAGEFAPGLTSRGRLERVDLQLGSLPEDSDGNGLPDAWELQYFGVIGVDPGDDPDGDGMSNDAEYRAGTNPIDPDSRFAVVEVSAVAGGVRIEWSSEPGRTYRVRRAASLLAAPGDYEIIQSGIGATPPLNSYTDSMGEGVGLFFYRIQLED
jgi:hypothetical protein